MKKSARWAWFVGIVAISGVVLLLAFVLSFSSQDSGLYERNFAWLFRINVAVAGLLALVVGFVIYRLAARLKRGKFGSRLLLKLAGIFALVGLLPGLLIYTVSYQFASRSIEAWFDVRVAGALDAGLALGKGTLEAMSSDLQRKTRLGADRIADAGGAIAPLALERLREQLGASEVSVVNASGQVLFMAGGSAAAGPPDRPAALLLRQARTADSSVQIEGLDDESLNAGSAGPRLRALARIPRSDLGLAAAENRLLMVVQPLPRALAANALAVQAAYSEYQQRALARDALRRMYIGTLTLALILAVFAAVLLAIVLGNQLVRPLLLLADGVRQVAEGDLTVKPVFSSNDELGGLTRSFAAMTAQVADARAQVQGGMLQLEGARTRLQTILDTLTAGVVVFDPQGRIDTVNPGATRILQRPLSAWRGRRLAELPELAEFAAAVERRFELLAKSPEIGERDDWQESFELLRGDGGVLSLLVRGALLPGDSRLMVFDDITEVVSGQRSAAWAEVAKRLAHEIKNPLTPIQLSAERLQHRLQSKLEGADQSLLIRSVATIVNQVAAMQTLVNEFRNYARLPAAVLKPLDLNELVGEVLTLYGEAHDSGVLHMHTDAALPQINGDATQLRQVIHNLVQNALDSVAERADGQAKGQVDVITSCVRSEAGELRVVRLTIVDNGPGFSEKVLKRAYEPYVTTKVKGTGLGLAVVKKIADEHGARLGLVNLHENGPPNGLVNGPVSGPESSADTVANSDPESGPVTGARVSLSFSNFPSAPRAAPEAHSHGLATTPDDSGS